MGADERMEDINGKMGNRNTPAETRKIFGDIPGRAIWTASQTSGQNRISERELALGIAPRK